MFKKSLPITDRELLLHHPIIHTRFETRNRCCSNANHRLREMNSEFQYAIRFSGLTGKVEAIDGHVADLCSVTVLI
jgi:hypothetical protein